MKMPLRPCHAHHDREGPWDYSEGGWLVQLKLIQSGQIYCQEYDDDHQILPDIPLSTLARNDHRRQKKQKQ